MNPIIINPDKEKDGPKSIYLPKYAIWNEKEKIYSATPFIDELSKIGYEVLGYEISKSENSFGLDEGFYTDWVIIKINIEWEAAKIIQLLRLVREIYKENQKEKTK